MRKKITILISLLITGYSIYPVMAGDLYRWIDPITGRTMLNPSLPAYLIKEKRVAGTLADGKNNLVDVIIDVNAPNFDSKVKALMEKRIAREQEEKRIATEREKAKGEQEEKTSIAEKPKDSKQTSFSNSQICKAGIATMMGRDPKIMRIERIQDSIIYLSYTRQDDGKDWAYRCKIEGDKVIWSSDTGRWMTNSMDSQITFSISGNMLKVIEWLSGDLVGEESFILSQLTD